ncbi:hypothetical protein PUR34_14425 [Streptomyces sp. JV185]|nr:hypothetical protein [Streptomyces sp. JV185]
MAMTIKVYEVDRYGRTRIVRHKSEVVPLKAPPRTSAYPPCRCDRCGKDAPRHIAEPTRHRRNVT